MQAREHIDADGVHVVELSGEVDLHHSIELRDILARHADDKRAALAIDFTQVSYIDSAGLATLVEYVQKSMPHGGRFALGGVDERLRTIFDIARLDQVFSIHPTLAEAKAALST
jgi:anti-sigma B factor antagonist